MTDHDVATEPQWITPRLPYPVYRDRVSAALTHATPDTDRDLVDRAADMLSALAVRATRAARARGEGDLCASVAYSACAEVAGAGAGDLVRVAVAAGLASAEVHQRSVYLELYGAADPYTRTPSTDEGGDH